MIARILDGKHRGPLPMQQGSEERTEHNWKAHCPSVPTIKLKEWFADTRVHQKYKKRMERLFSQMDHILRMIHQGDREGKNQVNQSSISDEVVNDMLRNGIAEVVTDPKVRPNTTVFLIPEHKKQRYRVIHWTRLANEVTVNHYKWDHDVSKQADVLDFIPLVWSASYGATFDLKASFYQVELPEHLRDLFVFRVGEQTMRMIRLPMGFSLSCEILQIITQSLSEVVAEAVRRETSMDLLTFTHVDNFMFLSKMKEAIELAIQYTNRLILEWNVTLSESARTPATFIKFHALQLDLRSKEISITEASAEKLKNSESTLHRLVQAGNEIITMAIITDNQGFEPFLKVCARLTFWSRVMFRGSNWQCGDFASQFPVMNLIRAAGRQLQRGGQTIRINRKCIMQMISWFQSIPQKIAVPNTDVDPKQILEIFTDASTSGGGYIIQGHPMAFPWSHPVEPKRMGEAELGAILQALRAVPQGNSVNIFTDSKIAIGGITHGYSASRGVNECVRQIIHLFRDNRITLSSIHYINTKDNPADVLSRATDLQHLRIITTVPLAWEWEERAYFLSQDGSARIVNPLPVAGPAGTMRGESTCGVMEQELHRAGRPSGQRRRDRTVDDCAKKELELAIGK